MARGAGVELTLGLFGDTQVAARLLQASNRVSNASPWFRMLSGWLEEELREQFDREGGRLGSRWQELSPAYAKQKALDGYGDKPILERTGALRASLTKGGGDAIRLVAPHSLVFGSTVEYGPVHQLGSDVIPRRPMLELDRTRTRQVARSLGLFIARDKVKKPGSMFGGTGGGGR